MERQEHQEKEKREKRERGATRREARPWGERRPFIGRAEKRDGKGTWSLLRLPRSPCFSWSRRLFHMFAGDSETKDRPLNSNIVSSLQFNPRPLSRKAGYWPEPKERPKLCSTPWNGQREERMAGWIATLCLRSR